MTAIGVQVVEDGLRSASSLGQALGQGLAREVLHESAAHDVHLGVDVFHPRKRRSGHHDLRRDIGRAGPGRQGGGVVPTVETVLGLDDSVLPLDDPDKLRHRPPYAPSTTNVNG